ncbi:MAG: EthD domain-containing protein [Porticoccaceae bacterium]|nr:EthD domain-containing protein [Porticoccaceae bacterium]
MIKLAFCMRRLPGISRDEFQDYWLNKHADLVMSFQPAIGFKRYVQFHGGYDKLSSKAAEFRNSPEPFDGIAELWWEDEETMVKDSNTKEARAGFAALYEDEKHFIDMANSPMWYGTEHVIYDSVK